MLKVAFTLFVCAMYADTILLLAAVASALLVLEGQASAEPAFSLALQILLALVGARVLRRHLYEESGASWSLFGMFNSDDIGHSFERTAVTLVLYICCLIYSRVTPTNKFPIGIYGCVLLVGVVLWGFDVFVRLRRAHATHVARHENDMQGQPTRRRHQHTIPMDEFHSVPVTCVAAVLIAFPDIVINDPRWQPVAFLVGSAATLTAMHLLLAMLLRKSNNAY